MFLIAGEPSGDQIGGRFMSAIKEKFGGNIQFMGVGGEKMVQQGLVSIFPMSEISMMGIIEIFHKVFFLLKRIKQTSTEIKNFNPDVLITIDAPSFCFRVIKQCRRLKGFPRIHYVAPTVWAWRPNRVQKFAKELDHLLTLLPFEPPYFESAGLSATFVGHAALEISLASLNRNKFKKRHNISEKSVVLCLLLGSRKKEVSRHIGPFREAAEILYKEYPELVVVLPTIKSVKSVVQRKVSSWEIPFLIVDEEQERFEAMFAAKVALAVSGTITLELALTKTPFVVGYKTNPITYLIVYWLIKVKFVTVINILLKREAVPELLQGACTGIRLANSLKNLIKNKRASVAQLDAANYAIDLMKNEGELPSQLAAHTVLQVIESYNKN
ncbi:MAG: lipid-A-disaccharide synthase [Pseudomonadota bacterium]|nr:lipid-A-disaccharide synthase [Pseudomonadota bacterium]